MIYPTPMEDNFGILIDVAILTATVHSPYLGIVRAIGCSDGHFRLTDVGAEGLRIALLLNIIGRAKGYLTLTAAKHITGFIFSVAFGTNNTATCDFHRSLAANSRRRRVCWDIMEFVRPTQGKACGRISVLCHANIIPLRITFKVNETHRRIFTTSIDILLYGATGDVDCRISGYAARPHHRCKCIIQA